MIDLTFTVSEIDDPFKIGPKQKLVRFPRKMKKRMKKNGHKLWFQYLLQKRMKKVVERMIIDFDNRCIEELEIQRSFPVLKECYCNIILNPPCSNCES